MPCGVREPLGQMQCREAYRGGTKAGRDDLTAVEKKAGYGEIRACVPEKFGMKSEICILCRIRGNVGLLGGRIIIRRGQKL